jgi:phospholipid:diacylglycerol acyltransferase
MCVKGWKGKTRWNPAGIQVITQGASARQNTLTIVHRDVLIRAEYKHSPESLDLRGGALT